MPDDVLDIEPSDVQSNASGVVDLQSLYTDALHALESSEQADTTARLQLFTLIQKLYGLAKEGIADEKAFNAFCRKRNVPQTDKSDVFTKTVHLVWKDEKAAKSNMRYATILRHAHEIGKSAYDIPKWLGENDGVEATLRKARTHFNPGPSDEDLAEAKKIIDKLLQNIKPVATLKDNLPKVPTGHSLMLVRKDDAGKTSVVRVLNEEYVSQSMIDTAIESVAQKEFEKSAPFAPILAADRLNKIAKAGAMFVINRDKSSTVILTGDADEFSGSAPVVPNAIGVMSAPKHIGQFPDGISYWRGRDANHCFHFYKYKGSTGIDPNSTHKGRPVVRFKQKHGEATAEYKSLVEGHTGVFFMSPKKDQMTWEFVITDDLLSRVKLVDNNMTKKPGNELYDSDGKEYVGARFLHLRLDKQRASFSDPVGHTIGRTDLSNPVENQINIHLKPKTFSKIATMLHDRCETVKMYGSEQIVCFTGTDEQKITYRIYVPQLVMLPGKMIKSGDWCEATDYIDMKAK